MTREVSLPSTPSVSPAPDSQDHDAETQPRSSSSVLDSPLFRGLGLGLSAAGIAVATIRHYVGTLQIEQPETQLTTILFQPKLSLDTVGASERPLLRSSFDSVRVEAPAGITSQQVKSELAEVQALASSRTEGIEKEVQHWNRGAQVAWNKIARDLVAEMKLNPVEASRAYALLSVAQHDALLAARQAQDEFRRPAPMHLDQSLKPLGPSQLHSYPSEHAAIASASRMVLGYIFPQRLDSLNGLAERHMESRLQGGFNLRSDIREGDRVGRAVALRVIEYAAHDNPGEAKDIKPPEGQGVWTSSLNPPQMGLRPEWGRVKPWNLESGSQFRPPAPPRFGSKKFEEALAEVRSISDNRTSEQLRIAEFWADGPGTAAPPGHWNEIASGLIEKYELSELQAAQVYATMNMALEDAGIACWDAKYTYWLVRPSQVDPKISTPVGLPNFPAYVSGHSTFSAAASEVLSYFFPAEAKALRDQAQEASLSRVYGGIHYRFDAEQGMELGRKVGTVAVEKAKALNMAPIPTDQPEIVEWFKGLEALQNK